MNAALVTIDRLLVLGRSPQLVKPVELGSDEPLRDQLGRPLTDLRLSVTDRCNFRCVYCMPRSKVRSVTAPTERSQVLDFDEIETVAAAFVALGVRKVRITGGEPLVRRDLPRLVERLARLAIRDLCLTTNGSLLAEQAQALASAGLGRVTVSLDAIDDITFRRVTDGPASLSKVLRGIEIARHHGLEPIKINMVVQRGLNDHAIVPMGAWARTEGLELRFIEYMDVGCSNGWNARDVVTAREIRRRLHDVWPLEPIRAYNQSDTAEQFRYSDGRGKIGIVAAISRPFCGGCTRARVSSGGALYPCLFAASGFDLAGPLRRGEDLGSLIAAFWRYRGDRYSELRANSSRCQPRVEMSAIGG